MRLLMVLWVLFLWSCTTPQNEDKELEGFRSTISEIKAEFAPDKRVAIYDLSIERTDEGIILKGETNLHKAYAATIKRIANDELIDSVSLLNPGFAVINISVANLRSKPKHSAELATQALLGMVVNVYKKEGEWYLIQTPDDYLAWVDEGALVMFKDIEERDAYEALPKIIYTEEYGFVTDDNGNRVSDVSLGNLLEVTRHSKSAYSVRFPDGREGIVDANNAMKYENWIGSLADDPQNLVDRAHLFMGVPYLWGGTSFKGVDCSGFTKMVYLMNGRIIPRDASQQVHTGKLIDENKSFESLAKGDLLFFGEAATDSTRERVRHVAMWIGDGRYIHSSGKVKINSMNPNDPLYSQARYDTYLRSKRILNYETDGIEVLGR